MSDVPSEVDNPLKESFIQRFAIYLAFGCFVIAAGAYAINFADWLNLSDSTETWGQLGDYLGGIINPIVGLLTICLLTVSLRQNQIALRQTREELKETRKAIQQAGSIQAATEDALRKQIEIADEARDMSNAVAIAAAYRERYRYAYSSRDENLTVQYQKDEWVNKVTRLDEEARRIEIVVRKEKRRLEDKYLSKASHSDS